MGYTKVIQSGKTIEVYEYERDIQKNRYKAQKRRTGRRTFIVSRRADNLARLRTSFVRLVRSNFSSDDRATLITFTFVSVCGVSEAYRIFSAFIYRFRKTQAGFRYIAVPEFQKRGAIHFHVLFWGLNPEIIKNERRNRSIQRVWAMGFVDCIPTNNSPRLAWYLAKYLSKTLQDKRLGGKKAYCASRNVLRPVSLSNSWAVKNLESIWGVVSGSEVEDRQFMSQWLGNCRYRQYSI